MTKPRVVDILSRRDNSMRARLARCSLALLRPAYAAATAARNRAFDGQLKKVHRLDRPVVSIGNITTGGTGKTPIVIDLARRLLAMDIKPAVLLRGYRAEPRELIETSDEAEVLRSALGEGVPVEPDPDRVAAAQRVLLAHREVDVFLLDDGFQHRRVYRDLDIVLLDATRPFGCDLPLPAGYRKAAQLPLGLLRESAGNLRRADAIVITRANEVEPAQLRQLDELVERLTGRKPIAHAAHVWRKLLDEKDETHGLDVLSKQRVAAVCGVANPQSFLRAARRYAAGLAIECIMQDHQPYTHKLIHDLLDKAQAVHVGAMLLTEKDWVKWRSLVKDAPLPIYRPVLAIEYLAGGEALVELLRTSVRRAE